MGIDLIFMTLLKLAYKQVQFMFTPWIINGVGRVGSGWKLTYPI